MCECLTGLTTMCLVRIGIPVLAILILWLWLKRKDLLPHDNE